MYWKFVVEFINRIELKYQIEAVTVECWKRGTYSLDPDVQNLIERYNWLYYGKKSQILQGDFLYLCFKDETPFYLEVTNAYLCYLEEGWGAVLEELERYREKEQRRKILGMTKNVDEIRWKNKNSQFSIL